MRLGLCQLPVTGDLHQNHAAMESMVREAADRGCEIVCLPEMWPCPYEHAAFIVFAEPEGGETWDVLRRIAQDCGVYLIGGSVPEQEGDRVYNTCYVFSPAGEQIAKHRKVHLFDIDVLGGQRFMESSTFTPGDTFTVFDTPFGCVGVAVCFDIRFVEQFRAMALEGAKIILVPGAFNLTTGPAHWALSFRMRAVDNQCFTAGCSPARDMTASYHAWGHSMVCDPWGRVLQEMDENPGLLVQEIDLGYADEIRDQIPILKNRRTDLYRLEHVGQERDR